MVDEQKWFTTSKVGPLLASSCRQQYDSSRAFIFPAETRFAGKLLQIKRFLSMREALELVVESAQYRRFDFDEDIFAERVLDDEIWDVIQTVIKTAGPADHHPVFLLIKHNLVYVGHEQLEQRLSWDKDLLMKAVMQKSEERKHFLRC